MTLNNNIKEARSGKADSLVIFLHGYGADGKDLLGLADPLAQQLSNTMFMSPDAPNSCKMNPMGFEWFPIPRMDGSTQEQANAGRDGAAVILNGFLDEVAKETGIPASRTFLLGFSQGCMMSLHVAPRRTEALAGVIGMSGKLLEPEKLAQEAIQKPPVLLVHGDQDDVVPFAELEQAANALSAADFDVYALVSKGTAHGIANDGLGAALQFIQQNLKA
jgi:phospholipase/carboxylesterase